MDTATVIARLDEVARGSRIRPLVESRDLGNLDAMDNWRPPVRGTLLGRNLERSDRDANLLCRP